MLERIRAAVTKDSVPSALSNLPLMLLALGFTILVAISGSAVWLVAQTRSDAQQAMRTLDIKKKLADLQGRIWQTESDQRGFLLTGNARYRDAFHADVETARAALEDVKATLARTSHVSDHKELVATLDAAVAADLAQLERTASRRPHSSVSAFSSLPDASANGPQIIPITPELARVLAAEYPWTERIRTIIEQLRSQVRRQLTAQIGASQSTGQLLLMANLIGALLLVAIAVISIAMVQRSMKDLRGAHQALEDTNESLEATVARRTAELRQANQEIQNFAHVVSHDLRSPLVNIMGFTGELEVVRDGMIKRLALRGESGGRESKSDARLAQEFDEALGFIKNSTTRMDRLIKAILKLTREGRRELKMEPINMTELVQSMVAGLGYQAQQANATITIEPLPPCNSDRLAVEQIFANLLENSLKYLREDVPGRIRVTGSSTASELVYKVQDNGRGIDNNDLERIFVIFRRSGPQDQPGEGIGLTHVRAVVHRLEGAITVDSEPGRGSTFTVTLPRRPQRPSPETLQ